MELLGGSVGLLRRDGVRFRMCSESIRFEGIHSFGMKLFMRTVRGKLRNRKKVSEFASVNVRKVKFAETQNAVGEWNS